MLPLRFRFSCRIPSRHQVPGHQASPSSPSCYALRELAFRSPILVRPSRFAMNPQHRRLLLIVAALVVAAVFVLSGWAGESAWLQTKGATATERLIETEAQGAMSASSTDQIDGRSAYSQTVSGRLVWKGGLVVAGGQVRCGTREVVADANGAFTVADASVSLIRTSEPLAVALSVRAPCWNDWLDLAVTARASASTTLFELGDVELDPMVDFVAEIEWSPEFADVMAVSGVDCIRLEMKASGTGQRNEALVGAKAATIRELKLQLRCRVLASHVASLRMSLTGPSRPQSLLAEQVQLLLTTKNQWSRQLGVQDIVRGRICDHLGLVLTEASLEMATKGIRASQAPLFLTVPVGKGGTFIAYLDRRFGASMRASLHGTRSGVYEVASGPEDVVITVDLSSHARIRLHRGATTVSRFRLDVQPTLFALEEAPTLPNHENGIAWCPKWMLPKFAYLAWEEDGIHWEESIELLSSDTNGIIDFDLDSIKPQVLCNVAIKNTGHVCSLRLTRSDPAPPSPSQRLTRLLQNNSDVSIACVPPGLYAVEVIKGIRRSPTEKRFTATVVIRGIDDQISVDDIVSSPK